MAAFYQMFSTVPRPPVVAHVCEDLACRLNGAEDVCADLERALGPAGEPALGGEATWLRTPCLGRCERGPTALFTVAGLVPETIAAAPVDAAAVVGAAGALPGRPEAGPPVAPGRGGGGPPGKRASLDPPGGPARAPDPAPRRRGRPAQPRRLRGHRRVRRPAAGPRDRAGRRDRGGDRVAPPRPRGGRLPDRPQVGGRRRPGGASPLHGLQRGRVRARHLQGPRADGGGPLRDRRGDDDRGVRDRQRAGVPVPPRGVPALGGADGQRDRGRAPCRLPGRRHPGRRVRVRHRDPPGRRRLRLRRGDGALQLHRGQARRARATSRPSRWRSACSASPRPSTTSRRWSTSP